MARVLALASQGGVVVAGRRGIIELLRLDVLRCPVIISIDPVVRRGVEVEPLRRGEFESVYLLRMFFQFLCAVVLLCLPRGW